jgi:thiol-disulfide isomerase/thioredoxin
MGSGVGFKCPHCKARLRFTHNYYVVACAVWTAVAASLVLVGLGLLVGFSSMPRVLAVAVAAGLVGGIVVHLYAVQGAKLKAKTPGEPLPRGFVLTFLLSAVVFVAILTVATVLTSYLSFEDPFSPQFPSGEPAVLATVEGDWRMRTLGGEEVRLSDLRGKVVFLNVWATWCPPCVGELPSIEKLAQSLKGEEVAFVLVSQEQAEVVRKFAENKQLRLPFYVSFGPPPKVFETNAIPATFVLNRRGEVVYQRIGSADWDTDKCRRFLRGLL